MAGSEVKYNNFWELKSLISFLAEHGQLHYDSVWITESRIWPFMFIIKNKNIDAVHAGRGQLGVPK